MAIFSRFFGGAPDKKAFGQLVMKKMAAAGETRPMVFDEARFQVSIGGPGRGVNVLWLGNAWAEYCALPRDQRDGVFERYRPSVYSASETLMSREDAERVVLPRVRSRLYPVQLEPRLRRQLGAGVPVGVTLPSLPYRALADVLCASLCLDYPTRVVDCTSDMFTRWGAGFDDLWPAALRNLEALSEEPLREVAPGVFVSPWSDSHDAARLLLTRRFEALPLKGAPVAAVPNPDELVVTGSDDEAGLDELVTRMKMGLMAPRPLSSMPLVLRASGWAPFEAVPDSAAGKALAVLGAQCRLEVYESQQAMLTEACGVEERDVFVASYVAELNVDGRVRSSATWASGVPTLLPRCDVVSLVQLRGDDPDDADIIRVRWEDLQGIAGHRMRREADVWPERWLVEAFPSDDELAKLVPLAV